MSYYYKVVFSCIQLIQSRDAKEFQLTRYSVRVSIWCVYMVLCLIAECLVHRVDDELYEAVQERFKELKVSDSGSMYLRTYTDLAVWSNAHRSSCMVQHRWT